MHYFFIGGSIDLTSVLSDDESMEVFDIQLNKMECNNATNMVHSTEVITVYATSDII